MLSLNSDAYENGSGRTEISLDAVRDNSRFLDKWVLQMNSASCCGSRRSCGPPVVDRDWVGGSVDRSRHAVDPARVILQ